MVIINSTKDELISYITKNYDEFNFFLKTLHEKKMITEEVFKYAIDLTPKGFGEETHKIPDKRYDFLAKKILELSEEISKKERKKEERQVGKKKSKKKIGGVDFRDTGLWIRLTEIAGEMSNLVDRFGYVLFPRGLRHTQQSDARAMVTGIVFTGFFSVVLGVALVFHIGALTHQQSSEMLLISQPPIDGGNKKGKTSKKTRKRRKLKRRKTKKRRKRKRRKSKKRRKRKVKRNAAEKK